MCVCFPFMSYPPFVLRYRPGVSRKTARDASSPLCLCVNLCVCLCNCLFIVLVHFSYSAGMLRHKCFCLPSADSVLNGNHQPVSSDSSSRINNVAKDLQDSLVLKGSQTSSSKLTQSSLPTVLNGRDSSPQSSPAFFTNESNFENTSLLFSSSSSAKHSSSQNLGDKTPPVPARSIPANQKPVPHPRTSLSVASSGTGTGQRALESPKLHRNMRAEATSSPATPLRGSEQDTENTSSCQRPSPIQFPPAAPPSPRLRGSPSQRRPPSPMREQGQHLSHGDVPQQRLRTPEPNGSTSLRELSPHSPHMSHRGAPGLQGSASLLSAKPAPESPQGQRKLTTASRVETVRALRAQSPSPSSGLEKETGSRQMRPGPGSALISGLGSLPGSSPHGSPRSQRKATCMTTTGSSNNDTGLLKPRTRERKNSISEISDNEEELLEYHRWQREERLREQEMEKLVSDQN